MTFDKLNDDGHVSIGSLDDTGLLVHAQYNPRELQVDKSIPWQKHNKANANGLQLEFTGAEGRTMSLELLFDGFEKKQSVRPQVQSLEQMASVRDPVSTVDDMRRPHHCVVVWGTVMGGSNRFQCVIEQISTKYTMFSRDGVPLRATVTLKLKEAERLSMARDSGGGGGAGGGGGGGGGGAAGGGGT